MLSTLPPFSGNPFAAVDGGTTPWDFPDLSSVFDLIDDDPITNSSSGSDEPERTKAKRKSPSASDDQPDRPDSVMSDRKKRRVISNRESARRSRMRKQRHLENLRNQVNQFKMENRDLSGRMQLLLHLTNRVRAENEWLRSERTVLSQKLSTLTHYLVLKQLLPVSSAWPRNTSVTHRIINLDPIINWLKLKSYLYIYSATINNESRELNLLLVKLKLLRKRVRVFSYVGKRDVVLENIGCFFKTHLNIIYIIIIL